MRQLFFILLTIATNSVFATATWELRVQQSNFDIEAHTLNNFEYKPYLAKTSWRCWAEKPTKAGKLHVRALHCNYSIDSTGAFRTYASCGPGKNVDEVAVELNDERKNLNLKINLSCQFSEEAKL